MTQVDDELTLYCISEVCNHMRTFIHAHACMLNVILYHSSVCSLLFALFSSYRVVEGMQFYRMDQWKT